MTERALQGENVSVTDLRGPAQHLLGSEEVEGTELVLGAPTVPVLRCLREEFGQGVAVRGVVSVMRMLRSGVASVQPVRGAAGKTCGAGATPLSSPAPHVWCSHLRRTGVPDGSVD